MTRFRNKILVIKTNTKMYDYLFCNYFEPNKKELFLNLHTGQLVTLGDYYQNRIIDLVNPPTSEDFRTIAFKNYTIVSSGKSLKVGEIAKDSKNRWFMLTADDKYAIKFYFSHPANYFYESENTTMFSVLGSCRINFGK